MNKPYVELAKIFLPNALVIIDKYHFIWHVTWAIENIKNSKIPEFQKCTNTFKNWINEIKNAFRYGYTNGPIKDLTIR